MADNSNSPSIDATPHSGEPQSPFTRHRFELKRRSLTITSKEYITPKMIRIVAKGDELSDFVSKSPDDHIKLIAGMTDDGPIMRDYTPRAYSNAECMITVDFAVHEAGPVTEWAIAANIGDDMRIAGPRGSAELTEAFDWVMLIGDETALPAMGRWVEENAGATEITTLGIVTSTEEEQQWESAKPHKALWVHRPAQQDTDSTAALSLLKEFERPSGKGFIWIAAEASVARAIKSFVLDEWKHPSHHLKSSGYWVKGLADTVEK